MRIGLLWEPVFGRFVGWFGIKRFRRGTLEFEDWEFWDWFVIERLRRYSSLKSGGSWAGY